jgi:hypothetical protein
VEDKLHGLVVVGAKLFLDVLLGVVEDFRFQFNISRSVYTVYISKRGGAGELGVGDFTELLVGVPDFFGLSVKTGRVHVGVVDTIFFSTGHTEFKFKKKINLGHTFHVLLADGNVFFEGFLGEVKHVRREEGFAVFLVVLLVGLEQGVEPRQPSLLAMVSVKNNRDTVKSSDLADVLGGGDASSNGGRVVFVGKRLSGDELSTSLGESHHDGTTVLGSGFHTGVDGVRTNNIDTWDGISGLLGRVKEVRKGLASNNTRLNRGRELSESLSPGVENRRRVLKRLSLYKKIFEGRSAVVFPRLQAVGDGGTTLQDPIVSM